MRGILYIIAKRERKGKIRRRINIAKVLIKNSIARWEENPNTRKIQNYQ